MKQDVFKMQFNAGLDSTCTAIKEAASPEAQPSPVGKGPTQGKIGLKISAEKLPLLNMVDGWNTLAQHGNCVSFKIFSLLEALCQYVQSAF
jgi:hypothetical protein